MTANTKTGSMHIMAKMVNPEVMNEYMASKNRRKSSDTLPPLSRANVLNAVFAITISHVRSLLPSNQVVKCGRQSC